MIDRVENIVEFKLKLINKLRLDERGARFMLAYLMSK